MDAGLPGPPGSAPAPRSKDPEERKVEERLFKTDGGRVVLKAIRAHGGWKRWLLVKDLQISGRRIGPEGKEAAGGAGEAPLIFSPQEPTAIPGSDPGRILAAPFWFAHPDLRLEYLGIEVSSWDGKTYSKVQVFQEKPNKPWSIAYFDLHTGILDRILSPSAGDGKEPQSFSRVDLGDHREIEGLILPGRATTFILKNRFARADLAPPDRVEVFEIAVHLKSDEPPPPR